VNFSQTSFLTVDDLIEIADAVLPAVQIRDLGAMEAAAARPQTTLRGELAFPTLPSQAAALMHALARNHPLVDGNKRLAWSATKVFLLINGEQITYNVDDAEKVVVGVASGTYSLEQLTDWLVQATAK